MMETSTNTRPMQIAYTIVERAKDGKKFWLKVGTGFFNRDGSINVRLDAMPVNGKLHIRDYKPFDEQYKRGGDEALETRNESFSDGGPAYAG